MKKLEHTTQPEVLVQPRGKEMIGKVVSTGMNKTVIVAVTHSTRHRLYKKAMRRTKHFAAHNESIAVVKGDHVRIIETKPISKTKHFLVLEKIL